MGVRKYRRHINRGSVELGSGRRRPPIKHRQKKFVSRFTLHPILTNPIPHSVTSLELILAQKSTKRSKKDLRGLWDKVAPGKAVFGTSQLRQK